MYGRQSEASCRCTHAQTRFKTSRAARKNICSGWSCRAHDQKSTPATLVGGLQCDEPDDFRGVQSTHRIMFNHNLGSDSLPCRACGLYERLARIPCVVLCPGPRCKPDSSPAAQPSRRAVQKYRHDHSVWTGRARSITAQLFSVESDRVSNG